MCLVFLRTDRIAPCLFVMFDIFNINFFKKYDINTDTHIYISIHLYEYTYVHYIPINFDHLYYSKYKYIYIYICKIQYVNFCLDPRSGQGHQHSTVVLYSV
jgi:hypothetical protein